MTVTSLNIIPAKSISNSQTTQYTASTKTIVDKFTATNTGTVAATLSINIVFVAGSPSSSNLILKSRILQPGETYLCPEIVGQVLETGSFISTLSSVASAVTISASGREIS